MAKQKQKLVFVCRECGHEESKWLGRCPDCGAWNTFEQQQTTQIGTQAGRKSEKRSQPPVYLHEIPCDKNNRFTTGNREFDRVLGGGIMRGSAVLLGGEPGIGKSTLMLQMLASTLAENVLYVTGEESLPQIRMRAQRLGITIKNLRLVHETNIDQIMKHIRKQKPELVVVDSIQTLISDDLGLVPGTVSQVKFSSMELTDWAKQEDSAVFLIGHVTKDGSIAGPKVVEHLVDTVLNFEQADSGVRIIRASKNRFGSVDEIGVFMMESTGLLPVEDPATFFLQKRSGNVPPGTIAATVFEGTRTFMVEIQALTVAAKSGLTRVYSDRVDTARVSRIAAVIEKHLGIPLSQYDIYINVAGGIRLNEVGIELPLALAIYSAVSNRALQASLVSVGELSLAGEVRPVRNLESRIKTSGEMGFRYMICPQFKQKESPKGISHKHLKVSECTTIAEAISSAVSQE